MAGLAAVVSVVAVAGPAAVPAGAQAPGVPPTPIDVTAVADDGRVMLRWTVPPPGMPGETLTFVITPSVGGVDQAPIEVRTGCCQTGEWVEGLTNGTAYRFTVATRSDAGTSAPSARTAAVRPQPWAPFASADRFTRRMHRLFAFRAPTAQELAAWRQALETGAAGRGELVLDLQAAQAWDRTVGEVVRLYRVQLTRVVDAEGLAHWSEQLRSGVAPDRVARAIGTSAEARERGATSTDVEWVQSAYTGIAGRRASPAEVDYWVGELARGVTRWKVAYFVGRGPERSEGLLVDTGIVSTTFGFDGSIPDMNAMWWYQWQILVDRTLTLVELAESYVPLALPD